MEILQKDLAQKAKNDSMDFARLIAPVTPLEFDENFFENKHFHLARNNKDYYKSILTISDLERILYEQTPRFPSVRLTNAREDVPADKYVNGDKVNTSSLLKHFAEGSTIVMSGLHEYHSGLGELVSHLSKTFYHKFQTNVYITPKSSQGFKVHYDTHDVFVLQIQGKKTWKVYGENPLTLPNKMQEFEPGKYEHGPMIEELELRAGDILYIPRGVMHQAETDDELSIHVTLGWLGFTWTDLIVESVLEYSKKNAELRKFLPHKMLRRGVNEVDKDHLKNILSDITENFGLQESVNRFKREMAISQKPNISKLLSNGDLVNKISSQTELSVRKNILYFIKRKEGSIILEWLGKEVEFPDYTAEAIEYISKTKDVFYIADIPDCLDDEGKIVLIKRLIKEGLVQIEII